MKKQIVGWCLFDVANSSYTTLITTVAFNVIFVKLIVGPDPVGTYVQGSQLWAFTLAFSWGIGAFLGPVLGSYSDRKGCRKSFLVLSVFGCVLSCFLLMLVNPGNIVLAICLLMTSNLAYSLSENFIAAFLPHLVSTEKMGKLSGLAWGMGYFGGLGSILICQKVTGLQYDISNWERLKWVGPITGIFFLVASIPSLLWLKEPPRSSSEGTGLDQIMHTWLALKRLPDLKWFLISCFLYQGGIAIVISFAALYGELEIGLSGAWQAIFFISLQLTAASGAFFFGWIQNRLGAIRTLDITLVIWVISVLLIFSLPMWARLLEIQNLKLAFVIVGNVTGACLGATQSCGRAVVGLFSPKERSGEFFGLWGFSVKCASVFSLFFFGILQAIFSLRLSLLLCAGFFLGSLVIHRFIDEKRGIELGV